MQLLLIPAEIVGKVWPKAEQWIAKAVEYSRGTHTLEAAKARAESGEAQLWLAVEDKYPHTPHAAAVTSLALYPSGAKALLIELLGGEDIKLWFDLKSELELYAKREGCKLVFCWARKGWAKHMPDYRITHHILTKELASNVHG